MGGAFLGPALTVVGKVFTYINPVLIFRFSMNSGARSIVAMVHAQIQNEVRIKIELPQFQQACER